MTSAKAVSIATATLLAAILPAPALLAAQTAAPAPAAGLESRAAGPASLPVEAGEGRAVALKLGDELVRSFVYTDQAEAYAAMLRKNAAAGRYDSGTRGALATLLTDDLQAVHKDGHLHVQLADGGPGQGGGGAADRRTSPR